MIINNEMLNYELFPVGGTPKPKTQIPRHTDKKGDAYKRIPLSISILIRLFIHFAPRILQGYGTVEDRFSGFAVVVHAEIAHAFELEFLTLSRVE